MSCDTLAVFYKHLLLLNMNHFMYVWFSRPLIFINLDYKFIKFYAVRNSSSRVISQQIIKMMIEIYKIHFSMFVLNILFNKNSHISAFLIIFNAVLHCSANFYYIFVLNLIHSIKQFQEKIALHFMRNNARKFIYEMQSTFNHKTYSMLLDFLQICECHPKLITSMLTSFLITCTHIKHTNLIKKTSNNSIFWLIKY